MLISIPYYKKYIHHIDSVSIHSNVCAKKSLKRPCPGFDSFPPLNICKYVSIYMYMRICFFCMYIELCLFIHSFIFKVTEISIVGVV